MPVGSRIRKHVFLVGAFVCALTLSPARAAAPVPDDAMMQAANVVARFVDTLDETNLADAFADADVTIIDNFPPYIFSGSGAVARWSKFLKTHLGDITNLHHEFGPAQEFSQTGDSAYFSLPVTYTELYRGKPVTEHGTWAFVMVRQHGAWKVRGSVWARVDSTAH